MESACVHAHLHVCMSVHTFTNACVPEGIFAVHASEHVHICPHIHNYWLLLKATAVHTYTQVLVPAKPYAVWVCAHPSFAVSFI